MYPQKYPQKMVQMTGATNIAWNLKERQNCWVINRPIILFYQNFEKKINAMFQNPVARTLNEIARFKL